MHYRLWTPCTTYLNNPGCNADNDTIRVDFAKGMRVTVLGASVPEPAGPRRTHLAPCPCIALGLAPCPSSLASALSTPHTMADVLLTCSLPIRAEKIATACASGFRLTAGKCVACPAGTFEYQTQACIPVDSLHYMPTNTSVEADQLTCPPNTRTVVPRLENGAMTLGVVEGAESLAQCRCDDGYYLPDGAAITTTAGCAACPAGAVCRGTYFPPIALVGYGKVRLIELVVVAVVLLSSQYSHSPSYS